jgi:uncharacterized protein (TIGR02996 family)
MSSLERLLEAIYDAPDDDAPRLVYADALLERGDPRGEFIVRQCRGDAATDLLEEHGDRWLGELVDLLVESTFERGFLAKATISDEAFRTNRGAVGHPNLRMVRELRGPAAVAVHPVMTSLRVLHVPAEQRWSYDAHHRSELLSGAPRSITELHYEACVRGGLDETSTAANTMEIDVLQEVDLQLAECSALPNLRRLVLRGVPRAALPTLFAKGLLDRVPLVETHHGPIGIKIAGGLAAITVVPMAPSHPRAVLAVIGQLPEHLAITLTAGPRFDRSMIERALGKRLR